MTYSSTQKYIAEFVGAFFLLVGVTGAVLVAVNSPATGYVGPLVISLAIGLVLAALIYAIGDVSGGHFNPAVTAAMALARRMPTKDIAPYIIAQLIGGFLGVLSVAAVAHGSVDAWNALRGVSFGSQGFAPTSPQYTFPLDSVFFFEVIVTFVFIFVIMRVTRPDNASKNLAPLAIGLTLTMANLLGIGIDGASFNPARSFSPALVAQIWPAPGVSAWALGQSWLFWIAPIIGGLLAAAVDVYVFRPKAEKPDGPTPPA